MWRNFVFCSVVSSRCTLFCTHLQRVWENLSSALKILQYAMAKDAQLQPFDMDEFAKKAISPYEPYTNNSKKRIGRDGFNKRLVSTVDELKVGMAMQDTRALVLACASGVGKTFGTSTARQGFQQQEMENGGKKRYEPVVAYIGFNCASTLSCHEEDFLVDGSVGGERCVQVLVLSRLFAWLNGYQQLQSEKQQLGPTVLDIPDSDVQMQFRLGKLMTKEYLKGVNVADITTRIKQMLEEFGKQTPGLVLIVVVDEGQFLDRKREDGARFALKCLRELQRDMMGVKEAVRVLPVCTGINPQTHLSDAREGQNISLGTREEALLSMEEFDSLLHTVHDRATRDSVAHSGVEEKDLSLFAALTWPRVRPVMRMITSGFKHSFGDIPLVWEPNTTACDVRRILQAAADGDYLAADFLKVPNNMVRIVHSNGGQCPVIDYSVLDTVRVQLMIHGDFSEMIPDKVHLKGLSKQRWTTFENNAFRTLALFLLFFYHNREATHPLPTGKQTSRLTNWVPKSVNKVKIITLKNKKSHSHPFKSQSHKHRTELSEDFQTALEELKVGDTILLHCGGPATIDFILVTLEEGKTLQVRYADAKFRQNTTNAGSDISTGMRTKARNVHTSLCKCLKKLKNLKKCSLAQWNDDNFLLITNSEMEGDCVMSPLTTTWEPMTTLLYRSTGTEEVIEDEEEEESQKTSTHSNKGDGRSGSRTQPEKRNLPGKTGPDQKRRRLSGGS